MPEVDREMFDRAVGGDREAFWRLVVPYRGLIYSVARGMLRDHDRAEDQIGDVLIRAFRSLPNLRDPARGARVVAGLRELLRELGQASVRGLIGSLEKPET